jgi:hypothetical protein
VANRDARNLPIPTENSVTTRDDLYITQVIPLKNTSAAKILLKLRMIIHSPLPNQSVALLADGASKIYRLRRGDMIGNATVIDITATKVTFTVDDFGNRRQEVLDIKANQKEGA